MRLPREVTKPATSRGRGGWIENLDQHGVQPNRLLLVVHWVIFIPCLDEKSGPRVAHVATLEGWFYELTSEGRTDGASAPAASLNVRWLVRSRARSRHTARWGDLVLSRSRGVLIKGIQGHQAVAEMRYLKFFSGHSQM